MNERKKEREARTGKPDARFVGTGDNSTEAFLPDHLLGLRATQAFLPDHLLGLRATQDIRSPETGDVLVKEGRKFTRGALRQLEASGLEQIPITLQELLGRVTARDIIDPATQEVLVQCNEEITQELPRPPH